VTSEIIERWCSGEQKKEGQTVREND